MSHIPDNLKFTTSHEWVQLADDGTANIGITDHAQTLLGDLVFVELPEVGDDLAQGDECAVVESVKAASDVYAPVSGQVVACNGALEDAPETINEDPYAEGWLFRLKLSDTAELDDLLDAAAYRALCEQDD
ncbi:MAG: glycine cleavage system protein GcvH [Pseudomonadota bacterium]